VNVPVALPRLSVCAPSLAVVATTTPLRRISIVAEVAPDHVRSTTCLRPVTRPTADKVIVGVGVEVVVDGAVVVVELLVGTVVVVGGGAEVRKGPVTS